MSIKSITKNGSMIVIELNERETPVQVSCKDFTIISFTGRQVKRLPALATDRTGHNYDNIDKLMDIIKEVVKDEPYQSDIHRFRKIEPYILYLDMVDMNSIPEKCPKGFIKWAKDNNTKLSNINLAVYLYEQKTKNLSENMLNTLNIIKERYTDLRYHSNEVNWIAEMSIEQLKAFCKIFNSTIKGICWDLQSNMDSFLYKVNIEYSQFKNNWHTFVDTNRSFVYNIDLLKIKKDEKLSKQIAEQESKIAHINGLSTEKYVVVVPKNLEDLINEGRQQNNCVGHYYNTNIVKGTDVIYFIRRKDKIEKSNTTCRYRYCSKKTVEARIVNNHDITDDEVWTLIHMVDEALSV